MEKNIEIRTKSFDLTSKIIDKVGPRLAGTQASLDAAEMLYEEINTFADHTEKEHFMLHKGAFLGWIRILVTCYLLGVVFLWLRMPYVTLLLLVSSILILILQFFLYKPFIDFLYPKKSACNVVGTIEPTGKPQKHVIISGHHDSARIFNFFIHQPKLYNLRVTGGIGLVVALLLVSIVLLFLPTGPIALILKILMSVGFILTGQMWFFASSKGTPGAGDNLISSSTAVEIGRYFHEHRLEHTKLSIVSFDAEEEGLRGARAYAKLHKEEFQNLPTVLLNADCPYYLKDLFFLTSDINGSVQMSEELAKELVDIAASNNITATHKPIAFLTGGTDAGELAKVGVKATTLMAMPWNNNERASVYHTPNDTVENIEVEAVDAMVEIFLSYIQQNDK